MDQRLLYSYTGKTSRKLFIHQLCPWPAKKISLNLYLLWMTSHTKEIYLLAVSTRKASDCSAETDPTQGVFQSTNSHLIPGKNPHQPHPYETNPSLARSERKVLGLYFSMTDTDTTDHCTPRKKSSSHLALTKSISLRKVLSKCSGCIVLIILVEHGRQVG